MQESMRSGITEIERCDLLIVRQRINELPHLAELVICSRD